MKAIKTILLVGFIFTQFSQMQIQMAQASDKFGDTGLHKAAGWEDIDRVKQWLNGGTDINVRNNQLYTALHKAANYGRYEISEFLIEKGIDINATNKFGETALHSATYWDHPKIMELLIEKGIDIEVKNTFGETALHKAAIMGYSNGAKVLIDAGADVDVKSYRNETAAEIAQRLGHTDIFNQLETPRLLNVEKQKAILKQEIIERKKALTAKANLEDPKTSQLEIEEAVEDPKTSQLEIEEIMRKQKNLQKEQTRTINPNISLEQTIIKRKATLRKNFTQTRKNTKNRKKCSEVFKR